MLETVNFIFTISRFSYVPLNSTVEDVGTITASTVL